MIKFKLQIISLIFLTIATNAKSQDKIIYQQTIEDSIKKDIYSVEVANIKPPKSIENFKTCFHFPPVSQGKTGTCWAFSTISFIESELVRMGKQQIKLSEIYIVYWEYVEKVRHYVQQKGSSFFGQGSEHNAVIERMKQYGIVPHSFYTGLINKNEQHDHSGLFKEINNYLLFLKENQNWDEAQAISYTKIILNKYLGEPPETIDIDGQTMTPVEYMKNILEFNPNDYIAIISMMHLPYYEKGEFKVPDNWWHSNEYYNIPLQDFYSAIEKAVKNGYSLALGGDTSELGKMSEQDIAFIPTFDIPSKYIDQSAREYRFHNETSTDDHAIHLVGSTKIGKHAWFLIKDSGRSSRKGKLKGYFMFRDDYIKLKILNILVHRDAVAEIIKKFD